MASQTIEPFQANDPDGWFLRMEAAHSLLEASSGNSVEKKTFLLATIGASGSSLLAKLFWPTKLDDALVTYGAMKDKLTKHLRTQTLEMAERAALLCKDTRRIPLSSSLD